jgi:hypothetical protein
MSVVTGAEDDGRRRGLQLVIGGLGWLLLVLLLVVLVANPTIGSLHLAMFFIAVITLTTFIAVESAIQLRSQVIRDRALPLPEATVDETHDTLGRPLQPPDSSLTGEIILETVDGMRRYASRNSQ